jgi:hypothetical protein
MEDMIVFKQKKQLKERREKEKIRSDILGSRGRKQEDNM